MFALFDWPLTMYSDDSWFVKTSPLESGLIGNTHVIYRLAPRPGDLARLLIDTTRVTDARALIRNADLIAEAATTDGTIQAGTGRHLSAYELVHYAQPLKPGRIYKGTPPHAPYLATVGLEPLPPAHDPLNDRFSGPLTNGERYVLFLRATSIPGTFLPIGGWQGIYPIDETGKTLAIEGQGFLELARLTPEQLAERVAHAH